MRDVREDIRTFRYSDIQISRYRYAQRDIADGDINRIQPREEQNRQALGIRESRQLERPAHVEEHAPQTPAGGMDARQQVGEGELDPAVSGGCLQRGGGGI